MEEVVHGWWVTGLIEGEGCFQAAVHTQKTRSGKIHQQLSVAIQVCQRADNYLIVTALLDYFGAGVVNPVGVHGTSKPKLMFRIADKDGLRLTMDHFERFPIHGKKRFEYAAWKEIAEEHLSGHGNSTAKAHLAPRIEVLRAKCARLAAMKRYDSRDYENGMVELTKQLGGSNGRRKRNKYRSAIRRDVVEPLLSEVP